MKIIIGFEGRSEICVERKYIFLLVGHYARFLILAHFFLKEIGLPFEGYVLHEIKGVCSIVELKKIKCTLYLIRDKSR